MTVSGIMPAGNPGTLSLGLPSSFFQKLSYVVSFKFSINSWYLVFTGGFNIALIYSFEKRKYINNIFY